MQLTGRSNFSRFGTAMGFDLIGHPGLVSDKMDHAEIGLRVAAWFCGLNGVGAVEAIPPGVAGAGHPRRCIGYGPIMARDYPRAAAGALRRRDGVMLERCCWLRR